MKPDNAGGGKEPQLVYDKVYRSDVLTFAYA
jgi:hypothetical protein